MQKCFFLGGQLPKGSKCPTGVFQLFSFFFQNTNAFSQFSPYIRVEETSPGIYLVSGDYLPIQIIESRKLPEDENLWLNSLRGGLKRSSLNVIYEEEKKQGPETPLDAYMDVIIRANKRPYMEVDKMWRDTLVEVLEETGALPQVIEAIVEKREGKWEEQGRERTARNLLARSMPIEDIAQVTELPIEKIRLLAAVH